MVRPILVLPDNRGASPRQSTPRRSTQSPYTKKAPVFAESPNGGPPTPVTPQRRRFGTDITNTVQRRTPIRFELDTPRSQLGPRESNHRKEPTTSPVPRHEQRTPRLPRFAVVQESSKPEQKGNGRLAGYRARASKSRKATIAGLVETKALELLAMGAMAPTESEDTLQNVTRLNPFCAIGWNDNGTPTLVLNPKQLPLEPLKPVKYTQFMEGVVSAEPPATIPNQQ